MSNSTPNQFYVVGGTVPPESPSYIERMADTELYEHLRAGDFCYILTSRQMGKSSIMARAARRLQKEQEAQIAIVDLTEIGTQRGRNAASRWYYGIAHEILRRLQIECDLPSWWREREKLPALQRLSEFLGDVVLANTTGLVVIFVDEIDTTIHLPFASDFFAAIRACYNQRAVDPKFRRLTFVLLGVASPSRLIADAQRTPFNIGHRIDLDDFTFEEAMPLTKALRGSQADRERQLRRVFFWTSGHPYLTQKTLSELSAVDQAKLDERTVDDIVSRVFIDPPISQAERNIEYVRESLTRQVDIVEDMKAVYRLARSGRERVDDDPLSPVKSALKLSGLLKVGENGQLAVRNRIYERTFVDWEAGDAFYKIGASRPASGQKRNVADAASPVRFTTAKIVLVGDSGVGKTSLGWRLAHGDFKEHSSSHNQQFWVLNQLGARRKDGTECEAILWDFAGQPDYRLIHALFLDDADLALVLFDPTDTRDPLHGVEFWLRQLESRRHSSPRNPKTECPIILVGGRVDRAMPTLMHEELDAFCRRRGISSYIGTSALTGEGLEPLVQRMRDLIQWDDKAATVTTAGFKHIRDCVLELKENRQRDRVITNVPAFYNWLHRTDKGLRLLQADMMTAIGHLENYGYVKRLRTSKGEHRILLAPELLNNLAASFVLEARRNPRGLGSLEEKRLLAGGYPFHELEGLKPDERDILLDSATLLFLEHNVCFRETDPLRMESYIVFPELINLKRPIDEDKPTEDGVAYTVTGPTENVFASLVVLLGYTHTFTRTSQWQNHARYEVGDGSVCGFRQDAERDGELDFVLCFCPRVGQPVRTLFQGLFESFLARRNLTVTRYEPVRCTNANCGHLLDRSVVRQRMKEGKTFAFCNDCGEKLPLAKMAEPIQLTREVQAEVDAQRHTAEQRTCFEQAIYRVQAYVAEQKIKPPACFISYAWGVAEHERWVEKRLATDLQKAGLGVVLDRWHNAQIGTSVSRFIERIYRSDRIIIVGTPLYFQKFQNKVSSTGSVVASEVDLISQRLMGTEADKETVMPILLAGEKKTSLPPLMWDRVHRDFGNEGAYFTMAFDLILDLYDISHQDSAIADLRESLCEPRMR
jgi:small GTP-binding protein